MNELTNSNGDRFRFSAFAFQNRATRRFRLLEGDQKISARVYGYGDLFNTVSISHCFTLKATFTECS